MIEILTTVYFLCVIVYFYNEANKYKQISEDLYKEVEAAEQSRDRWFNAWRHRSDKYSRLQEKLAKFERPRDESGKFIAKK